MDITIRTRGTAFYVMPHTPIPDQVLESMQLALGAEDFISTAYGTVVQTTLYNCKKLTGKENSALQRHRVRELLRMYEGFWLDCDFNTTVTFSTISGVAADVATMRMHTTKTEYEDVEVGQYRVKFCPNVFFE